MAEYFLRKENKYLLDQSTFDVLMNKLDGHLKHDKYNKSHLLSVYYDSDDYRLITKSIEKPEFKEKLRIRSYGPPLDDDQIYVELKKKFDGVVYKRRTMAKYQDILKNIDDCKYTDAMVGKEIISLSNRYGGLKPKVFVSCDRQYFVGKDDDTLRITFDSNLMYRTDNVYLNHAENDVKLNDSIVMEIKAIGAMPLWLTRILDELHIFKTSYSKVGSAFLKGEINYV